MARAESLMAQYLLALDTATTRTSVALLDGSRTLIEVSHDGATGHGEALPQLVAQVLKDISPSQLEAIVVGIGPGPFTGLRVGIAFARSMAWALDIGVIGVCTLDALAHDYLRQGSVSPRDFAVATDARRKEVYWAAYDRDGNRLGEPIVTRSSEIPGHLLALPTAGSGAALYPQKFSAHLEPLFPTATAIGQLGFKKLSNGELFSTEPLYLRRPDAVPPTSAMTVSLRPMNKSDLDAIYQIERDVYRIDPWSKEQIASEFAGVPETRHYIVAESGGRIVGYAGLFSPSEGVEADVQTVTVVTALHGKGIGRALLMNLIEEASRRSAPAILLEVRVGNDSAIHLYQSCGFVEIARRPNYYGRDLHALVMRKPMLDIAVAQ